MKGRIVILTGARGVGKSTACNRTVWRARAAGWSCRGLVTLSRLGGDRRDVMDVHSGQIRRLTRREGGVRQGRFVFDTGVLAWGARRLGRVPACDLLVVDELGPLELERGQGWAVALDTLRRGAFRSALVVVRPELLRELERQLRASAPPVVEVTVANRDQLPLHLFEMLRQEW